MSHGPSFNTDWTPIIIAGLAFYYAVNSITFPSFFR